MEAFLRNSQQSNGNNGSEIVKGGLFNPHGGRAVSQLGIHPTMGLGMMLNPMTAPGQGQNMV